MDAPQRQRLLRLLDRLSGVCLLLMPLAPLRKWEGGWNYDLDIWWWTNIADMSWFWRMGRLPWHVVSVILLGFLVWLGARNFARRPSMIAEWILVGALLIRTFWACGSRIYYEALYVRTSGIGRGQFMRSIFQAGTDLPVLLTFLGIGAVIIAGLWARRLHNREQGGRILRIAVLLWTLLGFLRPGAGARFWTDAWTVERRMFLGGVLAACLLAGAIAMDQRVADDTGDW